MEMITSFKRKETRFLSNFYPVTVTLDGEQYAAVEDAFQAAKTLDMKQRRLIQLCQTPAEARKCGRRVTLRPDWNEIKLDVMLQLLRQKFSRPDLKALLLATEDAVLIEGNTHHDNFWGNCTCKRCAEIEGENHLGKLLMQVREEMKM